MENSEKTSTYETTINTRFNNECEQRQLVLAISYENVTREDLIEKASKYDVVQFQRALRTSFDNEETFDAFHNTYPVWNVHTNNVGKKIVTPETQKAELLQSLKTLPADVREALLADLRKS